MENELESIPSGTVTTPEGFQAGATNAGIKYKDKADLAVLFSEVPCTAAGVFTTNKVKAAPVALCQQRIQAGKAQAIVVNSGCANACTGEQGLADAVEMAELAARAVGVAPDEVLVASTGVIGRRLPMERLRAGMGWIALSREGGHEFARAIMTTDTVAKETAVRIEGSGAVIGGAAKGAGMIHPDMATLLSFLTTDASVEPDFLKRALRRAADVSFNMISIDGDTSTNDTLLLLANGKAGGEAIVEGTWQAEAFQKALNRVCIYLSRAIARDGEGATRLIEVRVSGASSTDDARRAARTIISSPLVKTAVHGNDPNWGRVLAAAGRSGAEIVPEKMSLDIGGIRLVEGGTPLSFDDAAVVERLKEDEVTIALNLNLGSGEATGWGCDMSEEYVSINSEYTT
jgi:glutamate N-acetyltransferase/amino-acid N-acetyltransferase